jgi:hypothetical protein
MFTKLNKELDHILFINYGWSFYPQSNKIVKDNKEIIISTEHDSVVSNDGVFYIDSKNNLCNLVDNKLVVDTQQTKLYQQHLSLLLDKYKLQAKSNIDLHHSEIVNSLLGSPTKEETDTWSDKAVIAHAILSNQDLVSNQELFLTSAGFTTPESQKTWAESVISKANQRSIVIGLAEKIRDKTKDNVYLATSEQEVDAALAQAKIEADEAISALNLGK